MTPQPRGPPAGDRGDAVGVTRGGGRSCSPDHVPLRALSWRSIGPLKGGRSIAVAGSPARPLEYYFGATGGGLWKTTDGGTTWEPVTDGQIHSSSVGAVAVAPSRPDVVYIGMGESQLRGNVMQGDGVYRSADAGRTWRHAGLADTLTISRIRVHPDNPDSVYVAALGDPTQPTPDARRVPQPRRRRDLEEGAVPRRPVGRGGPRHRSAHAVDDLRDALAGAPVAVAALERRPGLRTLQVHRRRRHVDRAHPRARLSRRAARQDWHRRLGRGSAASLRRSSKPPPADCTDPTTRARAGRSSTAERDLWQRSFYFNRVAADPRDRDLVYVLNFMIARSADGGATYRSEPRRARRLSRHVDRSRQPSAADRRQRRRRVNQRQRRRDMDRPALPDAQLYRVETTADFPYHVVACQQDNMSVAVPERDPLRIPDSPTRSAAARVAGSRRIPRSRTSSSPDRPTR